MEKFYITALAFGIFFLFQCLYIVIPIIKIKKADKLKPLLLQKPISILIPAFNEQDVILSCISSLMNLNYKSLQLIIINDGSTDNTMRKIQEECDLQVIAKLGNGHLHYEKIKRIYQSTIYPNIYVLDKENGGKADALNAGIDFAEYDIVLTLDADCIVEKDALHYINLYFSDPNVVAAGGSVQVAQSYGGDLEHAKLSFNGNGLVKHQLVDYLNAFFIRRLTQQYLKSLSVIAGAFGVFRKSVLIEVEGYRKTIGEDMDITLKIQRYIKSKNKKGKLICISEAIAFTEVPEDFSDYFKQRVRWQKAFIDCMFLYRKNYFKGAFNWSLIAFLVGEAFALGVINSISVLLLPLYFIYGSDFELILYFFIMSYYALIYQNLLSLIVAYKHGVKFHSKDYVKIIGFIPIEVITYRVANIFIFIYGTIMYFKNKNSWNKVNRLGTITKNQKRNATVTSEESCILP